MRVKRQAIEWGKKITKHKSHLKNLVSRMYREVSQLNIKPKI